MNLKNKNKLLESKLIEFNLIRESTTGIQTGIISGLIVLIGYGVYRDLLDNEISLWLSILISSVIFYGFYYFAVKKPLNRIHQEIKILCKK